MRRAIWLLGFVLLLAACGGEATPTPTLLPQPTTAVSQTGATAPPAPTAVAEVESTTTPAATNTAAVVETTVAPTPTMVAATTATATTAPETPTATTEPTPATGTLLGPGQLATVSPAPGEWAAVPFAGTRFVPRVFFIEAGDEVDTAVSIYGAIVTPGTDLDALTPLAEVDNSGPGIPEIVVYTPEASGEFSLVVTADGEGEARIYAVDTDTRDQVPSALAAGETKQETYTSEESGSVFVIALPADQADLMVRATTPDGETIAEADFGGAGSVEALFVLPPRSAEFRYEISEVNGEPAQYHLFVGRPPE